MSGILKFRFQPGYNAGIGRLLRFFRVFGGVTVPPPVVTRSVLASQSTNISVLASSAISVSTLASV